MPDRSPPAAPRWRLGTEAPKGPRALAYAVMWLLVAGVATWGAARIAIDWGSAPVARLVVALLLMALSTTALMLASDSVSRSLRHDHKGIGRALQWATTSFVALVVAVVVGAGATSIVSDRPGAGHVVLAFVFDLVAGIVVGLVAVALILGTSVALGQLIVLGHRALRLEDRANRWRPDQRQPTSHWVRGAALGAAGLVLSAVCTAIVTTVTTNRTGGPDTPTKLDTGVFSTVVLPVIVWFAATAAVWWLLARLRKATPEPHRRVRHGTHASALAMVLVIGFGWFMAAGVAQHARGELWARPRPSAPAVTVTDQQWSSQSPYLAQAFEPRLLLASGEHWHPTSVTWYVGQNPKPPDTASPFCNAGKPPPGCYEIKPPPPCDGPDPGRCAPKGATDPALYYRYVDAATDSGDTARPTALGPWMVIQYWVFYNYDSLHTWALTQWHEADWEQVSVLVHRDGGSARPIEVAFSEHCYGARVLASQVYWSGSHPVSYVGRGSHANYPRPVSEPVRQLRCSLGVTPRYLGVAGLFFSPAIDGSRLEIPVAYILGLRDRADGAVRTPPLRLISLDATPAVESFHGAWGLDNNLSFSPFQIGRLRSSAGPPAPEEQGPWKTPFDSMLCSRRWLSDPAAPPAGTCASQSS